MAGIGSSSSSSSEDLTKNVETQGVEPVDALLQRRKCELMYELKKLQHGERPVTGTDYRGKVDNFFSKRVNLQENATPVANVDDVEEHRPQQVTIEVQGLLQNRSVSTVLQSVRFRRSLENMVRTRLVGPTASNRLPHNGASQQGELVDGANTSTLSSESPIPPPPPFLPTLENTDNDIDVNTHSPASTPRLSRRQPIPQPINRRPASSRTADSRPVNTEVNTQPSHTPHHTSQLLSNSTEDVLRRWNHDDFVMEISELVHRQLVSSTLRGDFRNRLERHVGRRLAESGTDGSAVQEHILNLPPSNVRHNDFSHLGIPSLQDQQPIDDAVSVISATASATIPFAQSNAAVQREMSAMKAQIAQLSNMLKMSLDLQMDIQRSIRQEVAAAIGQASSSSTGGLGVAAGTQLNSRRADDSKCIICLDDDADAVLYRCGHICMCYACALRMRTSNGQCPVCRAPIIDILRAYRISGDH